MNEDCIFCKIVAGKARHTRVDDGLHHDWPWMRENTN